jgi:predicted nuclease with RNAse H fold
MNKRSMVCYLGIDIQIRRNCSYAVINDTGTLIESGWLSRAEVDAVNLVKRFSVTGQVIVGIDAPRIPLVSPRKWYWNGNHQQWEERTHQRGNGRHCEVVISAHRIANPQWTPLEAEAPEWMQLGFSKALEGLATVHEVFPTASYTLLKGNTDVRIDADFSACSPGPKDMLDAWVAAATVREFVEGRGTEVGGGDGLGTIILPRPLTEPVIDEAMRWPG